MGVRSNRITSDDLARVTQSRNPGSVFLFPLWAPLYRTVWPTLSLKITLFHSKLLLDCNITSRI